MSLFKSLLDKTKGQAVSIAGKQFLDSYLKQYGKMLNFSVQPETKTIYAEILLKGENTPIKVTLSGYEIGGTDIKPELRVAKVAASREWLEVVLRQFVENKPFELSPRGRGRCSSCSSDPDLTPMNGGFTPQDWERMRGLLCRLQDDIRDALISARASAAAAGFASVAAVTAADTIYGIDKVSEGTVLGWLAASWPPEWPVELVMEGIGEDGVPVTFPRQDAHYPDTSQTHHRSHRRHALHHVRQASGVGRWPPSRRSMARRRVCRISWRRP